LWFCWCIFAWRTAKFGDVVEPPVSIRSQFGSFPMDMRICSKRLEAEEPANNCLCFLRLKKDVLWTLLLSIFYNLLFVDIQNEKINDKILIKIRENTTQQGQNKNEESILNVGNWVEFKPFNNEVGWYNCDNQRENSNHNQRYA
jgi:hypothetical protein